MAPRTSCLAQRHGWAGEPLVAIANPMLDGSLIWQRELDEAERWLMEGEYALQSEVEPATEMLLHLLAFAVRTSQIHGIWGCTTERECAAVRRSTLSEQPVTGERYLRGASRGG
jgi:hypothetical protein